MKIVNQLLVVKQQGGGSADNPLIATTETEMTNYLNDTTKVGMFVKYTGPQTTNYFHNGIYQITTENNVAVFSAILLLYSCNIMTINILSFNIPLRVYIFGFKLIFSFYSVFILKSVYLLKYGLFLLFR